MVTSTQTAPRRPIFADQHGRGFIGFIIALIVVGYVGISLVSTFKVKNRYDKMTDFVGEALKEAERLELSVEEVKFMIVKKAKELGVPGEPGAIEVSRDSKRWRVHYEWDDVIVIPGFSHEQHFVVDKTWTRFR